MYCNVAGLLQYMPRLRSHSALRAACRCSCAYALKPTTNANNVWLIMPFLAMSQDEVKKRLGLASTILRYGTNVFRDMRGRTALPAFQRENGCLTEA